MNDSILFLALFFLSPALLVLLINLLDSAISHASAHRQYLNRQYAADVKAYLKESAAATRKPAAKSSKQADNDNAPKCKDSGSCKNPPAESYAQSSTTEAQPKPNATKTGVFAGETLSFTGTCPKMTRKYMIAHTERLGGRGYKHINTYCTLLVVGEDIKNDNDSLTKAARWHIPTITWQDWYKRAFGPESLPEPQIPQAQSEPLSVTLGEFAARFTPYKS